MAPRPGLALVGDAARTSDPLWGVGCGWALQTAEWLVDATAGPLLDDGAGLAHGIRAYRRRCRHIAQHDFFIADYAKARSLNPVERSIFAASTRGDGVARAFERFGTRTASALTIMDPFVLARTTRVNRAYADAAGTAPAWHPAEGVRRRDIAVEAGRCPMLEAGLGGLWGLRWAADNPASHASVTMVNTGMTLGHRWHRLARIWQTPRAGEAVMAATSRSALHRASRQGRRAACRAPTPTISTAPWTRARGR
ncbi:MAG: hypothetical protein WD250_01345 [Egibacteraceae bacterium]